MRSQLKRFYLIPAYNVFRSLGFPKILPFSITISVTFKCNSRCKTCFIWKKYIDRDLREREFKLSEFERTFESMGSSVYTATISGGEPCLRSDLPSILEALDERLNPRNIVLPTNCLLPTLVKERVQKTLERINPQTRLLVTLSLDGIGEKHDSIRGVKGNFERVLQTYQNIINLKSKFRNLSVNFHSVVSVHNIGDLLQLHNYVSNKLNAEHSMEVAEERTELSTIGSDITPNPKQFLKKMELNSEHMRKTQARLPSLAFRLIYMRTAPKVYLEKRQIVPCYAAVNSCQFSPYGEVWPCCIHADTMSLGNLRHVEYDFRKIWFSKKANKVRRFIRMGKCYCPLLNAHTTNITFHPLWLAKVVLEYCKLRLIL